MASIGTLEVAHENIVVVYDARTGRVVHRHEVVTLKGGTHPDKKTLEREALEHLRQAQPGAKAATAILHVDPRTLKPRTLYKVDVKKRALVEQPVKPARPSRRRDS